MTALSFCQIRTADIEEITHFPLNRDELFYFSPSATTPLNPDQLKKQISRCDESIVMLEGENTVGFANFYKVKKHPIAFIANVIIKPEKRKQGFAKKLLQYIINYAFNNFQLKEIHLSCYQENITALSLYKKIGFKAYAKEQCLNLTGQQSQLIHLRLSNRNLISDLSQILDGQAHIV